MQVPLTDHTYDLDAMLAAVTDRTRLIFVCNPNNPTSTVVDPDALARFVEAVPSDILIALDEAYVEYIRDDMLPDSFGLVRAHSNVVVLRTFSKAYGLAGLRVGYAVGDPDIITALGKVYVPFSATSISQAAAIASLDAADELLARTDAVVAERRTGHRGAARGRLHRPAVAGQLRLAAAAGPRQGVRRTIRPTAGSSSGPTATTGCGSPSLPRTRTTRSWSSRRTGSCRLAILR